MHCFIVGINKCFSDKEDKTIKPSNYVQIILFERLIGTAIERELKISNARDCQFLMDSEKSKPIFEQIELKIFTELLYYFKFDNCLNMYISISMDAVDAAHP